VLNNTALDGDFGSDGSTAQDRANAAGFNGIVAETVAINPALAINNVEVINQWYYRPDYMAIMSQLADRCVVGEQPGPQCGGGRIRPTQLTPTSLLHKDDERQTHGSKPRLPRQ
jgi:hypothetical protein